jgi:hypothetical protein
MSIDQERDIKKGKKGRHQVILFVKQETENKKKHQMSGVRS